jgi:hypothetical protein
LTNSIFMVNSNLRFTLILHTLLHLLFTQSVKPTYSLLQEQAQARALTKARKVPHRGTSSLAALPTLLPRSGKHARLRPAHGVTTPCSFGPSPPHQYAAMRLVLRLVSRVGSAAELQSLSLRFVYSSTARHLSDDVPLRRALRALWARCAALTGSRERRFLLQ